MRFWGIFATSLLVLGFLTACTPATTQVAARSVGDCWGISAGAAQDVFLDEGQAPVNCDENALSATYFVGQVQDAPDGGYLSDLYLEAKTLSDLPDTMHQDLINECQQQLTKQLSFESLAQLRQTRIVWDFTLPNHDEWNKGQRWFSCEMSLLEKGSLLVEPVWAGLPNGVDTVKEMTKNPSVLMLCFDTATNAQLPSSRLGIVASCDEARWKLQPIALDNGYGEFYPGTKQATLIANSLCEAKYPTALKTYAQPLLEQDWNSIQPTIQCWYSTKADPTSPEEVAAEEARIAAEQEALAETAARQAAANRAWREYLAQQEQSSDTTNNAPVEPPAPEETSVPVEPPAPEETSVPVDPNPPV